MSVIGVPLSVLDLVPVGEGEGPQAALTHTTELARCADRWGYHRYWVAKYRSAASVASPSPAVLLAHLGGVTSRIRLGSGGVMLTNHAPMLVAEQFGLLELLHPGRIDLGIGQAPDAVPAVVHALRREENPGPEEYPNRVTELLGFLDRGFPDDHPYTVNQVKATSHSGSVPVWVLGSSSGAEVAARFGLPFAASYQGESTILALRKYRAEFQPSGTLTAPHTVVAVNVVCADTDDEALRLALTGSLTLFWLGTEKEGRPSLHRKAQRGTSIRRASEISSTRICEPSSTGLLRGFATAWPNYVIRREPTI